jgi:hypothetical protein
MRFSRSAEAWAWFPGLWPPAPIAKVPTQISPLTFVEMAAVIDAQPLEVVLPSSVRIRVRPGFDSPTLGRLLDVLESRR